MTNWTTIAICILVSASQEERASTVAIHKRLQQLQRPKTCQLATLACGYLQSVCLASVAPLLCGRACAVTLILPITWCSLVLVQCLSLSFQLSPHGLGLFRCSAVVVALAFSRAYSILSQLRPHRRILLNAPLLCSSAFCSFSLSLSLVDAHDLSHPPIGRPSHYLYPSLPGLLVSDHRPSNSLFSHRTHPAASFSIKKKGVLKIYSRCRCRLPHHSCGTVTLLILGFKNAHVAYLLVPTWT